MNVTPSYALERLINYCEKHDYLGFDPYDGLKSPFLKLPIIKDLKVVRFASQQIIKRSPINLRPLLLIPKGLNPVTLGLCIQGYANLINADPTRNKEYYSKIEDLVQKLTTLIPEGFSGACWGYDFDWEARYAKIPSYQPTVVATGIISNALFIAANITNLKSCSDLVISSANFVLNDLKRTYDGENFVFSYSPFDYQQVFNASMKGARILAQAYSLTGNQTFKDVASKAVAFVVKQQNSNGSWYYSKASAGNWTDNYHTGYVLDCLDEFQKLTGINQFDENLIKGYDYYIHHFFNDEGFPYFYNNNKFPLDCTAASQAIITNIRFGNRELSMKVAQYTIANMQKQNGSFRFRKFKYYTINTSFMRWSNAWMFAALSNLMH
jgi:hypothetical protein